MLANIHDGQGDADQAKKVGDSQMSDISKPIEQADDDSEKDQIGKLMPNAGNGCTLEKYMWTQTLKEIEVSAEFLFLIKNRCCQIILGIRNGFSSSSSVLFEHHFASLLWFFYKYI